MKNIIWGMIGCGDVTEIKNGPGIYLADNSILKAVTNRTISKAEDWVRRHRNGTVYPDVDAVLNDPEIDIVYIATTPDTHVEYAIKCAQSGKHCLIEKPLALTYEEGIRIKEAFDNAGKKAFVAFYRRSLNRFNKIAELIKSGVIGETEAVNVVRFVKAVDDENAWRMQPEISGGNIFTETDIHVLDYIYSLMGDVEEYNYIENTFNKKNGVFDSFCMNVKFKSGVIGSGQWLYNCKKELDRIEIIGEKGIIRFDFFNNNSPIYVITDDATEEYLVEDHKNVGRNMEQEIVDQLNGKGSFSGTIEAALKTLKFTDEIITKKSRQI